MLHFTIYYSILNCINCATHYTLFYCILTTICRAWRQVQDCSSTPMETHWMQSLHRLLHYKLLYSLLQFTSLHISTVQYSAVHCSTVENCTAVYCTVLHCTALCVPLLWIFLVQWPVLHCSVWTVLCCTALQDTVSYYIGPSFRDSPMFYLLWILANLRMIRSQIREWMN